MIVAIVPAAGMSTRMGRNKLLLTFNGQSLIARAVDTLLAAQVDQVVVVLGHEAEKVRAELQGKSAVFVENPNYREGLSTSVRAGLGAVPAEAEAIMICLADQPLLQTADVDLLIGAFAEAKANHKSFVVPFFRGQRGNPVVLDSLYREAILDVVGDVGCRRVIKHNPDRVYAVEMETDHVVRDVDTLEDYERLTGSSSMVRNV
jgi:molybdenum cofactor cytidylyltransferase